MLIRFFIDSPPIPQPRQRHGIDMRGKRPVVRNYIKHGHKITGFKQVAQIRARMARTGEPIKGPLKATFVFLMARPGRLVWKTRPMPREPVYGKGRNDLDNLAKSVMDALTGITWEDDGQVCEMNLSKWYAAGDESPGVYVEIEQLS